jgi:hypothetical protein
VVLFGILLVLRKGTPEPCRDTESRKGNKLGILMALPGLVLIAIVYTFIGMLLLNGG